MQTPKNTAGHCSPLHPLFTPAHRGRSTSVPPRSLPQSQRSRARTSAARRPNDGERAEDDGAESADCGAEASKRRQTAAGGERIGTKDHSATRQRELDDAQLTHATPSAEEQAQRSRAQTLILRCDSSLLRMQTRIASTADQHTTVPSVDSALCSDSDPRTSSHGCLPLAALQCPAAAKMARIVQLLAASSYALTSVLILLFNKVILTTYSFKFPFTMALSHMVVGLILLQLLKSAKIIHYAGFDPTLARKALPVSLCFIANVVLGMVALKGTNIPMFASVCLFAFLLLHARAAGDEMREAM